VTGLSRACLERRGKLQSVETIIERERERERGGGGVTD
jgi:hypothetical protein